MPRCLMLLRNRVRMVDVRPWLIMGTVSSTRALPGSPMISIGSGSASMTRGFGNTLESGNLRKNPGVLNVCARTSTPQPQTATMLNRIVAIQPGFSRDLSNRFATRVIARKQNKRSGGGVSKMFYSGSQQALWASSAKKIPNVRNSGSQQHAS